MPKSIRTRLTMAFLGLALGPLLVVGVILTLKTYSVQAREAAELQREMAMHLSSRVESLILGLEKDLEMLIRVEDLKKLGPEQQNLILSVFHSRQPAIDDLILMDAAGQIRSSHSRLKLQQDMERLVGAGMEAFAISARGETYFGPVRFQPVSGEPLMVMAVPLISLETGKPEGTIVADIRLKEIWDLMAEIRPGKKGTSFIVDEEKRIIAHTNPSIVLRGTRFDQPDLDGVQTGLNGEASVRVSQGINFGDRQFHIFVEAPVSEALFLAFHTMRIMLAIVVLALVTGAGLCFFMVRRIVKPIEDIAKTARTVMEGDLSHRTTVTSQDEIGILAQAFNRMTLHLETLIKELEERVADRTAELTASNRELEAFAYSVSHDLRAPLRHINGFLELLEKKAGPELDKQCRHYMDTICGSANKMGLLIDELLSFSRMGRKEITFRPVEMETLVRKVIRDFEPDAAGRAIEWCINGLPVVAGDASMLRLVMENLVSNALKFTRQRPQARIEIGSFLGEALETVIFVRDNGVGFDMAYADNLFGVFQRLHREDEFEGTGIGLANVRRIITRHGGRTWAEAEINKGAAFFFSLPKEHEADQCIPLINEPPPNGFQEE